MGALYVNAKQARSNYTVHCFKKNPVCGCFALLPLALILPVFLPAHWKRVNSLHVADIKPGYLFMPIYHPTIHCGVTQLKECHLGTLEQVSQLNQYLYHLNYV